jgi:hypothetical protein
MGPLGKLGPRRVALPASRDKIYVGFPGERSSLLRSLWVIFDGFSGEYRLADVRFAPKAPKPARSGVLRLAGRL